MKFLVELGHRIMRVSGEVNLTAFLQQWLSIAVSRGGSIQLQCWGLSVARKSLVNLCNVFYCLLDYLLLHCSVLYY